MAETIIPTLFEFAISDLADLDKSISREEAEKLFLFFKTSPLFIWSDVHNNCEARAEAISILLEAWNIPHYKGWVFSGAFLKNHFGGLKQKWNYHVAALLPVLEGGVVMYYMIDPATNNQMVSLYDWAAGVTDYAHSYHLLKYPEYYIFPNGQILQTNWHKRNKQNQKWVMQGLAGINGLSGKGKAQLVFRKKKIAATKTAFKKILLAGQTAL
ncbi:MAG: protein-glutamine glutaminase family protein [Chitinophagaceae bacterium]